MESLGFVIGRHISDASHTELCFRAYTSIRAFYPDNRILIVDDGSKLPDEHAYDENTTVVDAAARGAGEFGLYATYHAARPFDRAVLMHDSMVLKRRLDLPEVPILYLWHFPFWESLDVYASDIETFLGKLKNNDELSQTYASRRWLGVFGCAATVTWDCLDRVQHHYRLFDLLPEVTTRQKRCVMERVLGVVFAREMKHHRLSLNGDIGASPGIGSRSVLLAERPGAMDKTWHGR